MTTNISQWSDSLAGRIGTRFPNGTRFKPEASRIPNFERIRRILSGGLSHWRIFFWKFSWQFLWLVSNEKTLGNSPTILRNRNHYSHCIFSQFFDASKLMYVLTCEFFVCVFKFFLQTTFISLFSVHTLTNLHIFEVPKLHEGSDFYIAKLVSL